MLWLFLNDMLNHWLTKIISLQDPLNYSFAEFDTNCSGWRHCCSRDHNKKHLLGFLLFLLYYVLQCKTNQPNHFTLKYLINFRLGCLLLYINAWWLDVCSGCKCWVRAPLSKGKSAQSSAPAAKMITSSLFVSSDLRTACDFFVPLLLLSWNLCGECCVMPLYFPLRWLSQACFVDTRGIWVWRLHGSSASHPAQTESPYQGTDLFHTCLTRK